MHCSGAKHDGHDYVTQAFADGAVAALVSRIPEDCTWGDDGPPFFLVPDTLKALQDLAHWWRRQHHAEVIGVTGSVGKTTTKEVTAAVLGRRMPVLYSEGNLNTEVGLPLTLLRLRQHHRAVVLEMGMYARAISGSWPPSRSRELGSSQTSSPPSPANGHTRANCRCKIGASGKSSGEWTRNPEFGRSASSCHG